MTTRLNKFIAHASGVSRREADQLIEQGRVMINGGPVSLGQQVTESDSVTIDGKPITQSATYTYLALNKPAGYVCSRRRQGDTPTIYELLPENYRALKAVGRLDKDSSGLLLLTDDGDFAHRMTHPSFHKTKRYEVKLHVPLQPLHQQMINDYGVSLEDGPSKLSLEKMDDSSRRWVVNMHEGRNRQIRRTFAALGYKVIALHRTDFGLHRLESLKSGQFREIKV